MSHPVHFDDYAENYDVALSRGLAVTGEEKDYFARRRIEWVSSSLRHLGFCAMSVMDYGCGAGSATPILLKVLGSDFVVGVDTSTRSVELAKHAFGGRHSEFVAIDQYTPAGKLDLAYSNGVFHHIPRTERDKAAHYIWRSLRPGGLFAFWENNPWNPGTRYVMSRIPFDRDALTLSPPEALALLRRTGFQIIRTDFLFLFPNFLRWLRWIEPLACRMPLGGQYQVLCRKPASG